MTERPEPPSSESAGDEERRRITGRAGIVAAGTLASRLLGLVRDQVTAAMFSRLATDAFFVAFLIPNVLRQLLAEGGVQGAILPVLARVREQEGQDAARRYFAAVRRLSLGVLALVTALGITFAPALVSAFAPGYAAIPGQSERTVALLRWVFPYIFFMGTAALGAAALAVEKRFVVASFAPALLNVSFIVLGLALPPLLVARGHDPVHALSAAVLVGGALQVVAQWPSLRAVGYHALGGGGLGHPGVREALRRMGPVLIGTGVYAIDVVIARGILSTLGVGPQSWFGWALRLCDFPQGVLVMAIQTATLPSLALLVARGDREEASRTLEHGVRLSLFVGLAATGLLVGLAEPLVVTLFQRGHFDAESSRETARALVALGAGIVLVAVVRQLVAGFYALGDTRTPVVVAAIKLPCFVAGAYLLVGPLGHVGVALAVAASQALQAGLLAALLHRKLDVRISGLARATGHALLAVVPAVAAGRWAATAIGAALGEGALAQAAPGLAGAAVFGIVALAVARVAGNPELAAISAPLRARLARGRR
ncbi:MAG: murein biosynthesis integral membrane protein MurJ [Polyangiaceae bacterium]|nr:murein biosynthesis integral membrane protein MurJ [Polyangiaceae bacterium]